ncbi:MAG: hypothetical protein RR731_00460, partial [Oscillospiraceae bacterium]
LLLEIFALVYKLKAIAFFAMKRQTHNISPFITVSINNMRGKLRLCDLKRTNCFGLKFFYKKAFPAAVSQFLADK